LAGHQKAKNTTVAPQPGKRMNTYATSDSIFHRIESYHRRLADFYDHASANTDQRTTMLVGYLADRQRRFATGVARFRHANPSAIDTTWQQFLPALEKLHPPRPDTTERPMSFDQAARQASSLEKRLTHFLKVMADKAGATGPLRSTFESLLRQHEEEQATLTQTITELERL
jgi:hypothetical protein